MMTLEYKFILSSFQWGFGSVLSKIRGFKLTCMCCDRRVLVQLLVFSLLVCEGLSIIYLLAETERTYQFMNPTTEYYGLN